MLFLLNTFFSVLFVKADAEAKTLSFQVPSLADVVSHTLDPAVFIAALGFAWFLWLTRGHSATKLSRAESLCVNWHLWNGLIT